MAPSKPFSDDLHWALVHMHFVKISVKHITATTGLSDRRIRVVFQLYRATGSVLTHNQTRAQTRNQRILDENDSQVSNLFLWWHTSLMRGYKYIVASLAHTPDMYLDEIKAQLEACGVKVSLLSIWRELWWKGFSMKACCWSSHFVPQFWQDHQSRPWTQWGQASSLYLLYRDQILTRTSGLCRRKFIWLLDDVSRLCLDFKRAKCCSQMFLHSRQTVHRQICFELHHSFLKVTLGYSILPAISFNGMLSCEIVEGSFNTTRFTDLSIPHLTRCRIKVASTIFIVTNNSDQIWTNARLVSPWFYTLGYVCLSYPLPEAFSMICFYSLWSLLKG